MSKDISMPLSSNDWETQAEISEMNFVPTPTNENLITCHNGTVSAEDYYKNYHFVCSLCTRRYSSITGLNYHMASFNHKNPPPNYDPHKISKRGRPRGWRLANYTPKPRPVDVGVTKMRGRRKSGRPRVLLRYNRENDAYRGLTYAEAQRVVQIEQKNVVHRVSVEEKLEVTLRETPSKLETSNIRHLSKKHENIPIATFFITENFQYKKTPVDNLLQNRRTYFRSNSVFNQKIEEVIEYEMDEEDVAWLENINSTKGLTYNGEDFEYVMDTLEKESAYVLKTSDGTAVNGIEEDVVCGVCLDGDCSNNNLIVFCDICNVAVHQDCYGLPYVPEGQWLCRRCSHAPSKEITCVLCPVKSGVFKQTVDGGWCHIICAIMIPGVKFTNSVFLEPIDCSDVSPTRLNIRCKICLKSSGAVIQCIMPQCAETFHASCAHSRGLLILEKVEVPNVDDPSLTHISHRYSPYCERHYLIVKNNQIQQNAVGENNLVSNSRNLQVPTMKSTSGPSIIHVPYVSDELLKKTADQLNLENALDFVHIVKRYWQIKRYMRSGVPLLRRYRKVPRNPVASFKINEKQLKNLDKIDAPISKLQQFSKNLTDCINILKILKRREDLKMSLNNIYQKIYLELQDFTAIVDFYIKLIGKKLKSFKFTFDRDELINLFHQSFSIDVMAAEKFKSFIAHVFDTFLAQQNITENVLSQIKSVIEDDTYEEVKTPTIPIEELIPPPDVEIVPSNLNIEELAENLVSELPDLEVEEEANASVKAGEVVWAKYNRVTHFPYRILKVQADNLTAVPITMEKGEKTVLDRNLVYKLGFCSSIDFNVIQNTLESKAYNRKIKRTFLEAYKRARIDTVTS